MDAHSISFTSVSQRATSRIWRDLKSCRLHSVVELSPDDMLEGLSLASNLGKRRSEILSGKPHVAVIGAGLSGLRCTDILLRHGFEVTLIEARDRLGGRVHQVKLPSGYLVDCGPNWIHGTKDNPIWDLAKETKTATSDWDEAEHFFDEDGNALATSESNFYSTMVWDIIEAGFRYSNKNCATISPDESLWDFFQKEAVKRIPDTEPDFEKKRKLVLQTAEKWGNFVGSPIYRQSLKFFWLEECIEGGGVFCASTYQNILHVIAQPAIDGADIKFSTKVTGIKTTNDDGDKVVVFTEAGETLSFDEVVMTAPLGWLKKHLEVFNPALPPRLTKAINRTSYGCLEKFYISFKKAFWHTPDSEGRTISGFCQWLKPEYAPDSNPEKWPQEIVDLGSLSKETAHPTLLFYMHGDQSHHLSNVISQLSTKEKDDYLYEWFKPYYSLLPNYDETSPDCQPTGCLYTDWLRDEFAGNGSYTNFQVGLKEGDEDIAIMREGAPDRGLWMAGEHTSPFVALGTATGAYWSGESVGKRIAQAYGRDIKRGGLPLAN